MSKTYIFAKWKFGEIRSRVEERKVTEQNLEASELKMLSVKTFGMVVSKAFDMSNEVVYTV